jgi:hypothetical protein
MAKLSLYDNVRLNPKRTYTFLHIHRRDIAFHPLLGEVDKSFKYSIKSTITHKDATTECMNRNAFKDVDE